VIVMNYQLNLPRTHDMQGLRERIPTIGHRFDTMPGLGAKAFLLREQGANGSTVNQYAPFYLWADDDAAAEFLWGGTDFTGVVNAYGRPVVQTWIGGSYHRGPEIDSTPMWAVRTITRLPLDAAPADTAAHAEADLASREREAGLHSAAFGIDPRTWELVTFSMHTIRPTSSTGELYEVPHLSNPAQHLL
jgi:hypothetical protein